MQNTITKLSSSGKGILAADESTPTMGKRLSKVGIENTEKNRHEYRRTIFSTGGLDEYISGVILFDETIRNYETVGPLLRSNIALGIKVDKGAKPYDTNGGKLTEGLDGLSERLREYKKFGVKFAKWRAVLNIDDTDACIIANAWTLARYAKKCQLEGLVPIVEPEILMDGSHDIYKSSLVTEKVLHHVFDALYYEGVELENIILKPNMVLFGYGFNKRLSYSFEQTGLFNPARKTLECFNRSVPAAVPMIAFLSGGQPDIEAISNLNQINKRGSPWYLSFSFGRALQSGALELWGQGKSLEAQEWIINRAKECSDAVKGVL